MNVTFAIEDSLKQRFNERAERDHLSASAALRLLTKGYIDGSIEIVARGAELATTYAGERRGDD